jgi:hypothetical protein
MGFGQMGHLVKLNIRKLLESYLILIPKVGECDLHHQKDE